MQEHIVLNEQLTNVGGWTAIATLGAWLVRSFILRMKVDLNDLKGIGAVSEGMDAYKERIRQMDLAITKLERDRARLVSFSMKVMMHFSGCGGCAVREEARALLQSEFEEIMKEVSQ